MIKILLIAIASLYLKGDLPYWAAKSGKNPTATCNQYRLWRSNTDPSIDTYFTYFDCYGISRTVYLGPDYGYEVFVCASAPPSLVQFPPPGGPIPIQAYSELQTGSTGCRLTPDPVEPEKPVDPDAPEVQCNQTASYTGGKSYPSKVLVDLGTSSGTVRLTFQAYGKPDKFIVTNPNASGLTSPIIASTDYRGIEFSYGAEICDFYGGLGFGCPTCQGVLYRGGFGSCYFGGGGNGNITFTKPAGVRWVYVEVYAPLSGTAWEFTLGCPF